MVARKNEVPLNSCNHNVILDNSLIAYLFIKTQIMLMQQGNIDNNLIRASGIQGDELIGDSTPAQLHLCHGTNSTLFLPSIC